MEQKKLNDDLAKGELGKLYLLFGEERFLVNHYATAISQGLHKDVFEGVADPREIMMAADTVPFLPGKRLIYVKDSKLFTSERKTDAEELVEYLPKIPDDTVLVFVESEVDRRLRIFKKVSEIGLAVNCEPPTPQVLTKWIVRTMKEKGKTISESNANVLQRTCGTNMANLFQEIDKLAHFCGEKKDVSPEDITAICTPTLEARIFDLTKAMGAGRASDALKSYRNMLALKESPFVVLVMIIRQLRIILLCKCAEEKGLPKAQIAKELNIRDFVISEARAQGRRFSKEQLLAALKNCQDTDIKIKTGLLAPEIGVEMLLAGLSMG
ncbi:MAG: DNA polymerase III subunit delta [Defluviitaleaceae bacterium]|nr:DNA polymerase III subunit delta [Defluviitaleaceae bacterium]